MGTNLKFIPIGGMGDVTKNMYVYEYGNDIIIIDCGVGFPDEAMPGIDLVIPDISYLADKRDKIRGIIITHGHDDHIGALPYLLPQLSVPVYAMRLTAGLIRVKLGEMGILEQSDIRVISSDEKIRLGSFFVEPFRVTHSIPDAVGYIIRTPVGTVVHTGDYKIDWTPVDKKTTEVGKIAIAGREGVLALFSDCVRSEKTGYTPSETTIGEGFIREFEKAPGRILITTFSSNISRIQQAIDVAKKFKRKVALVGRSMENNVAVAKELGYLNFFPEILIEQDKINDVPDKEFVILVSGSQAQPESALSRIVHGEHKRVGLKPTDLVIFASDPIPGNEDNVQNLIDNISRIGADVRYSNITENIHVSGHASQEELMLMLGLTRPKYLIPISGNYRHLKMLAKLGENIGVPKENIFIIENGQTLEFVDRKLKYGQNINLRNVMVDGLGIGDVGDVVLRDRKVMAEDGIVVIIVPVEQSTGKVAGEPDIVTRGFVYVKESEQLIEEAKKAVSKCVEDNKGRVFDWNYLRRHIENKLEEFFYNKLKRRPMVLPVVIEV